MIHDNIYILTIQPTLQSKLNSTAEWVSVPIWPALHACSIWSDLSSSTAFRKPCREPPGLKRSRRYHAVRLVSFARPSLRVCWGFCCLLQVNKHFTCSKPPRKTIFIGMFWVQIHENTHYVLNAEDAMSRIDKTMLDSFHLRNTVFIRVHGDLLTCVLSYRWELT